MAKLLGPTGGYLISFIISAFVIGLILEKTRYNISIAFFANIIGALINLVIGTIWLKYYVALPWGTAFASGFAPFMIVGMIKAFLAGWIGILVRTRLASTSLFSNNKAKLS